jgi:hypothetical protein
MRSYKVESYLHWAPWKVTCHDATISDDYRGMLFDWCHSQKFSWEFREGIFGFEFEQDMLLFVMTWG